MKSMPRESADVLKDALALPPEARAELVESLIGSLDNAFDAGAEQAWQEEIAKRVHEIDTGAVELLDWQEARRRLRSHPRR